MKGIEAVRQLSKKDDEIKVELTATTDEDLRAEIFRAAVESGLILIGLEVKTQNLEKVFRDLTKTGWSAQDAAEEEDDELEDEEFEDDEEYEDDAPAEEEE